MLAAGLFRGVIQSTLSIGHPAYKTIGARSGYTLATVLTVGAAGVCGYFDRPTIDEVEAPKAIGTGTTRPLQFTPRTGWSEVDATRRRP